MKKEACLAHDATASAAMVDANDRVQGGYRRTWWRAWGLTGGRLEVDLRLCLGSHCWSCWPAAAGEILAPALLGRWWSMPEDSALQCSSIPSTTVYAVASLNRVCVRCMHRGHTLKRSPRTARASSRNKAVLQCSTWRSSRERSIPAQLSAQ